MRCFPLRRRQRIARANQVPATATGSSRPAVCPPASGGRAEAAARPEVAELRGAGPAEVRHNCACARQASLPPRARRQDGGGGAEEEAHLPQVHLPRRGPGPAARHVLVSAAPGPASLPRSVSARSATGSNPGPRGDTLPRLRRCAPGFDPVSTGLACPLASLVRKLKGVCFKEGKGAARRNWLRAGSAGTESTGTLVAGNTAFTKCLEKRVQRKPQPCSAPADGGAGAEAGSSGRRVG